MNILSSASRPPKLLLPPLGLPIVGVRPAGGWERRKGVATPGNCKAGTGERGPEPRLAARSWFISPAGAAAAISAADRCSAGFATWNYGAWSSVIFGSAVFDKSHKYQY